MTRLSNRTLIISLHSRARHVSKTVSRVRNPKELEVPLEQRARKNMALPDFSDRSRFPSVAELPLATADATTDGEESQRWLLAQIKDTMTITQPTLVALDRNGVEFAITLDEDREGSGVDTAWRKGHCIAIRDARRTEGRSGTSFVKVARGRAARGDVRVVPGGLAAVLGLSEKERGDVCAVCGKEEGNRCMGCGEVRYCSKECQAKGWTEGGHKKECKLLKAVKEIWGE